MRVLHVCYTDSSEGAGIGAYRLHRTMVDSGIESIMLVARKKTNDQSVIEIDNIVTLFLIRLFNVISINFVRLFKPGEKNYRSLNLFPTGLYKIINRLDAQIVQFHWINRNLLGISEIPKINSPIVWKLPDMWAFSGAEHYPRYDAFDRYKEGYSVANRPIDDLGLDIDKWVWKYKMLCWKSLALTIVCPSKWLANCARESKLFGRLDIYNIANPIDMTVYKPLPKNKARQLLKLPLHKKLIMFAAIDATIDRRKGFHHLSKALSLASKNAIFKDCEIVIMGAEGNSINKLHNFPVHYLGRIFDESTIVAAYSAVDIVVLPTEIDNLPNIIQEAMACGTPCVSFNVGGLRDMIQHGVTGYLAKPYKVTEIAEGISWVLKQSPLKLSERVRKSAESTHSPENRVSEYVSVYNKLLKESKTVSYDTFSLR